MVSATSSIEFTLSQELLRKMHLALQAETADDRNIVCSEIFNDVSGDIHAPAQAALHTTHASSFYEVLAPFYCQNGNAAESLLSPCKKLWSQPYIVPVFALLLHVWLLQGGGAVGTQVSQHMNVLLAGVKQLFELDVTEGTTRFLALHANILVAINEGPPLPHKLLALRDPLIKLAASYVPYYKSPGDVMEALAMLPMVSYSSISDTHVQDYVVTGISHLLHSIPSVRGLLRYLDGLQPVVARSQEWKGNVGTVALLRLQSELYSLTLPGGPRYCPSTVRAKALGLLNGAFPNGRRSRGLVRIFFRLMHPSDWPQLIWLWLVGIFSWIRSGFASVLAAAMGLLRVLWAKLRRAR